MALTVISIPQGLTTAVIEPWAVILIVWCALLSVVLVGCLTLAVRKAGRAERRAHVADELWRLRSDRDDAIRDLRAIRRAALRRMRESTRDDSVEGTVHEVDEAS